MRLPLRTALRLGRKQLIRRGPHLRRLIRQIASDVPAYQLGLQVAARKLQILRKKYHRVSKHLSESQSYRYNADNTNDFLRLTLNNAYRTICALKEQCNSPPVSFADETATVEVHPSAPYMDVYRASIDSDLVKCLLQSIGKCVISAQRARQAPISGT